MSDKDESGGQLAKTLPSNKVLEHVVDVHCHPTDTEVSIEALNSLSMRICAMASRRTDQSRVAEIARSHPDKVTPAFGYHPWFSHLISLQRVPDTLEDKDMHYRTLFLPEGSKNSRNETHVQAFNRVLPGLPSPFALEDLISVIRVYLAEFVSTHKVDPMGHRKPMLGEVGLDRSFRVPFSAYRESETPAEDDGPRLTPFFVPIEHQLAILEAQVDLAVEFGINVSLHSVQAQAHTVSFFKHMLEKHGPRFDAISVDMHSCGVSTATWKDIERRHPNVYMSLSTGINFRKEEHRDLIRLCAEDRILVESDIPQINQCTPRTWAIITRVAEVKGWNVEEKWVEDGTDEAGIVHRLQRNWIAFESAGFVRKEKRISRKKAGNHDPDSFE